MSKTKFSQLIEKIKLHFIQAKSTQVIKPVTIKKQQFLHNYLVILHKGTMRMHTQFGNMLLRPKYIYFLPLGTIADVTYGTAPQVTITQGEVGKDINEYLRPVEAGIPSVGSPVFSTIAFRNSVYNAIDFFNFVEIPCLEIEATPNMEAAIHNILLESQNRELGHQQLLNTRLILLMIFLFRYFMKKEMFMQKIDAKISALMDSRLVNIVTYIANNLHKNLSNSHIAKQVNLSTDYVGPFFKKRTKISLQSHIRAARINRAIEIITTSDKKIQDVCKEVGIQEIAYFCRIFKDTIGATAKKNPTTIKKPFRLSQL